VNRRGVISPPESIETQRLRLRKPILEDAEAIFRQYARDPEVTKYLTWYPNQSVEQTREFVHSCMDGWDTEKSFQWAIIHKQGNQLIGMIGFRADGHKWELGYVLTRSFWRKGYMTEAVKALVEWALNQPEIYRVWAVCDLDNRASARVLEKAGMLNEGVLRRWSVHPNISEEPRDSYCYAITK
jgi:ribosomal-protein-alanine N-acetyltransferase